MKSDGWAHPLCTCPPITFAGGPDVQPCRDRAKTMYGVDPHPVLTAEDMRAIRLALDTPWSRHVS